MTVMDWLRNLPDWVVTLVDVAASAATAVAAVLAYVTIRQAKRHAAEAQLALLLERQIDFRLGVLAELASFSLRDDNVAWASAETRVRAAMLPRELVPITRAACNLPSTREARDEVGSLTLPGGKSAREVLRPKIQQEIHRAIDKTLALSSSEVSRKYQGLVRPALEPEQNAYY